MIIPIILVILIGIVVGRLIYNNNEKLANKNNIIQNEINIASEKVTDDCIEEYQEVQEEVVANSQEEKISPNCLPAKPDNESFNPKPVNIKAVHPTIPNIVANTLFL